MFGSIESRFAVGGAIDRDNPSDYILPNDIHLYSDKLIIEQSGLKYASVEDTKSMEPLLSSNSHVIEAKADVNTLQEGDIISFSKEGRIIIHSIVSIDSDSNGWYALTKGYNNDFIDDWKVRSSELKGVVVGVLN
jgi:signal peptidase I